MKKNISLSFCVISFLSAAQWGFAQDAPIRIDFSGSTAEENGVEIHGAGFDAYPKATVAYGALPLDNAFEGATDGVGAAVIAKPGQGVMIFGKPIVTSCIAVIRCTVRTDCVEGDIALATIDSGPSTYIGTIRPNNTADFVNRYKRIAIFYHPPSTGFQPLIQLINNSKTQTVMFYLDNFDVYLLQPGRFYNADFLDGDETDPSTISVSSGDEATPIIPTTIARTPTPQIPPTSTPIAPIQATSTPTPTPTLLPAATSTPTPNINLVSVVEKEPNDTVQQVQDIGSLKVNGQIIVSGNISKGGRLPTGGYSGDSDLFKFTLTEQATVTAALDWSGSADLDLFALSVSGEILNSKTDAAKPAELSGLLSPGVYGLLVESKDNPADYQFSLIASPVNPTYPNDVSILNGKYFQDPSSLLFWYVFDGQGNYQYWGWNPMSGDVVIHGGAYSISFPYLILNHDATTEKLVLSIQSATVILLDNYRYVKEQ